MTYAQGGGISACKGVLNNSQFWLSYSMLKNVPNIVPRFLYVDVLFFPMKRNAQVLIDIPGHLNREPVVIQSFACCEVLRIFNYVQSTEVCHSCLGAC